MKIHANESGAITALQSIQQAQLLYDVNYPAVGFACELSALGGDPTHDTPMPTAARLLSGDLPTGVKDGYFFAIVNCVKPANSEVVSGYAIVATPVSVGKTGQKGFCMSAEGEITEDLSGGSNCTTRLP